MLFNYIKEITSAEISFLKADWWILLFGIIVAVVIKVYMGSAKIKEWVNNNEKLSIFGSIFFGAFTPLCACGTMAVVLSMFASYLPWGPILAFLVSSPLTSPSQFLFQKNFLGLNLALAILVSSVIMGIIAGLLARLLEDKTNFFSDQYRIKNQTTVQVNNNEACLEKTSCHINKESDNKAKSNHKNWFKKIKLKALLKEIYETGIKRVLLYFMLFIAIGKLFEMIIPKELVVNLFSSNNPYSIPVAALIGLPLYISGNSALPLLNSFLAMGAGESSVLTFIIAGQGTGVAVITGLFTIIKKKALLFYILFILLSSIIFGYIYNYLIF